VNERQSEQERESDAERRLPATRTTAGWALLRSDVEAFARIPRKAGRQPRHTAK